MKVTIPVLAMVETKISVRLHDDLTCNFRVPHTYIPRTWFCKRIQIDDGTDSVVLKTLPFEVINLDVHPAGAK
jgi:hypothetical protein